MTEAEQLIYDLRMAAKEPCDGCCYGESMTKAADEIERLRAALKDIAIGCGDKVLDREEMRARAFDALGQALCPKPINADPPRTTVAQCVAAGHCGCDERR